MGNIKSGELENVMIRKNSLSTVANQVMLELNFSRKMDYNYFYRVITGAYPFRELKFEDYYSVLELLSKTRKIIIDGNFAIRRYPVLKYFIENISMIAGEKNYRVIDVINKQFIGTLDEKYVINEISPGSYFVMKGNTWRTIRIDEDKIYVEPFAAAAIAPHWTGEEIPVLYEAASRVSSDREKKIIPDFVNENGRAALAEWYKNDMATLDRIIVEAHNSEIVIQILLGSLGNFTLAQILSGLLTSITGESVEMDYSPYHIYMRVSRNILAEDIKNLIMNIDRNNLDGYVKSSARRSRFFNNVFLYEARKFGIITNEADITRIRFEKIVDSYYNTVVYEDSSSNLDMEATSLEWHTGHCISVISFIFLVRLFPHEVQ